VYLKNSNGTICLTIEETSTSKWLYSEVKEFFDKIIICNPYLIKLLSNIVHSSGK
jgi:hypothetical protein